MKNRFHYDPMGENPFLDQEALKQLPEQFKFIMTQYSGNGPEMNISFIQALSDLPDDEAERVRSLIFQVFRMRPR